MRGINFMSDVMKCPICTKDMKKDKNMFVCPDCGYRIMASKAASDSNQFDVPEKKPAIHAGFGRKSGDKEHDNEDFRAKRVRKVLTTFVLVSVMFTMASVLFTTFNAPKPPVPSEEETAKNLDTSGYRPKSDEIIYICETIFDKPVDQITRDELESVMELDFSEINDDYILVGYTLSDNTTDSLIIEARHIDTGDFKCFSQIQALYFDGFSIDSKTSFFKLKELDTLQIEGSIDELVDVMDVSQLRYLKLNSKKTTGDLSALVQFTNLETLYLETYNSSDLSGLLTAPALTSLYIGHGDNIRDFNELFFTNNLKELSIEAENLRNIDFLENYGQLEYFELKNTSVSNLDALSYCKDTLTTLKLHKNYNIELDDYNIVTECIGLKELELYPDYSFDVAMEVPDLSMLSELTSLSLGNYDQLSNLKKLPNLTQLTLCGVYCDDSEALSGLNKLEQLTLDDMSIPPEFFAPVSDMDKLTDIDMRDSFLWGDISCVFAAPSLTSLKLKDASIGINSLTLGVSDTITALDIDDTAFYIVNDDGSYNYGSPIVLLGENTCFFDAFPSLEYLNVAEQQLENLDFITKMPHLEILDISDNYITDLSTIKELPALKILICTDNPVSDTDIDDDVIIIK